MKKLTWIASLKPRFLKIFWFRGIYWVLLYPQTHISVIVVNRNGRLLILNAWDDGESPKLKCQYLQDYLNEKHVTWNISGLLIASDHVCSRATAGISLGAWLVLECSKLKRQIKKKIGGNDIEQLYNGLSSILDKILSEGSIFEQPFIQLNEYDFNKKRRINLLCLPSEMTKADSNILTEIEEYLYNSYSLYKYSKSEKGNADREKKLKDVIANIIIKLKKNFPENLPILQLKAKTMQYLNKMWRLKSRRGYNCWFDKDVVKNIPGITKSTTLGKLTV